MSDEPGTEPVHVTGEERGRPVFRLLARAAIEHARRSITRQKEGPGKTAADSTSNEEGRHA